MLKAALEMPDHQPWDSRAHKHLPSAKVSMSAADRNEKLCAFP